MPIVFEGVATVDRREPAWLAEPGRHQQQRQSYWDYRRRPAGCEGTWHVDACAATRLPALSMETTLASILRLAP